MSDNFYNSAEGITPATSGVSTTAPLMSSIQEDNTNIYLRYGGGVLTDGGKNLIYASFGSTTWRLHQRLSDQTIIPRSATSSTATTVLPRCATTAFDGSTEYLLGFADGGSTGYRYSVTGESETSVSFSGTSITGCQRIGYDKEEGYVYIQDGGDKQSTTVRRYTFSGTTLTHFDNITLSVTPTQTSSNSNRLLISENFIAFIDTSSTNSQTVRYYNKSGTHQGVFNYGSPNATGLLQNPTDSRKGFIVQATDTSGIGVLFLAPFNLE